MGNIFSTSKTVSASGESNIGTDIYSNVETVNTDCMTHNEHLALKVRIMKDQIAVASRNCGNEEKKLFTEVSKKFENAFAANNIILEIFFNRFDTENPVKTMNDFITEIANASSLKAIYDKKNFCKTQKNLMDKILYIEPKDIPEFANKNITQKISNPKVCE
jgi:hypothetical protein